MKSHTKALVIDSLSVVSLALLFGLDAGCNRDRAARIDRVSDADDKSAGVDTTGITQLTNASWVSNDNAIDRIVGSRCAREMTCTNVGPDKHFTSPEVCIAEVRKNTRDDLKVSECPDGIDGAGLDKCLDAIRSESCSNPLETVSRLFACRTADMCLKSNVPHR